MTVVGNKRGYRETRRVREGVSLSRQLRSDKRSLRRVTRQHDLMHVRTERRDERAVRDLAYRAMHLALADTGD
jgi:hypothetical protein